MFLRFLIPFRIFCVKYKSAMVSLWANLLIRVDYNIEMKLKLNQGEKNECIIVHHYLRYISGSNHMAR